MKFLHNNSLFAGNLTRTVSIFGVLLAMWFPSGGYAQNSETILRARVDFFIKLLWSRKFDDALKFIDPNIVASKGRNVVADYYMQNFKPLVTQRDVSLAGFGVLKTEFDEGQHVAIVQIGFFMIDTTASNSSKGTPRMPVTVAIRQRWINNGQNWYFSPQ